MIEMPLRVYFGLLDRLTLESRQYVVLKTAVIEHNLPKDNTVEILCDEDDGLMLLSHAKEFYPEAVAYIRRGLDSCA